MLSPEIAQAIVNRTMEILGKNVNLMNTEGMIIASGDKERVGTFHEGALKVIRTQQKLEIWPRDVQSMTGVRPGINLPIRLNGEIVGVVGITGDPDEVRNYGELVRITAELMIEQALLKEQLEAEQQAKEALLQDLIAGHFGRDYEMFKLRAFSLGLRLDVPMVALVIEILSRGNEMDGGVSFYRLRKQVGELLQELLKEGDVAGFISDHRFVVFKNINPAQGGGVVESELKQYARYLQEQLRERLGIASNIGIGSYHPGLEGLQASFRECLTALQLGRLRASTPFVFHIRDLALEEMISLVPPEVRQAFAGQVLRGLLTARDGEELLKTMEKLFAENLNLSSAANALYLHRNTLQLRLRKIARLTGRDPRVFHEAVLLYIAYLCLKLDNSQFSSYQAP